MSRGTRTGPKQAFACSSLARRKTLRRGAGAWGQGSRTHTALSSPHLMSSRAVTQGVHQASCSMGHGLHVNVFSPDRRLGQQPAQTTALTPGLSDTRWTGGGHGCPVPCGHRMPMGQHLPTPGSLVPDPGLSPPVSPSSTHQQEETDSKGPPFFFSVTRGTGTHPGCQAPDPITAAECLALGWESSLEGLCQPVSSSP